MYLLISLCICVLAGWLTGVLMKGGGYGIVGDLLLGLVGGWLGGVLLGSFMGGGFVGELVVRVIGAVILVAVVRLLKKA